MAKGRSSVRIIFLVLVFFSLSLGQIFFFDVDRCLDAGGAYDYSAFTCTGASGPFVSMFQGGGTAQLWFLIFFGSSVGTFIFDRMVSGLVRLAQRKNAF